MNEQQFPPPPNQPQQFPSSGNQQQFPPPGGQQQPPFGQYPPPGNQGYGPQYGGYPPPPQKKKGPNILLIVLGIFVICIVCCCGTLAWMSTQPEFIVSFWVGAAGAGGAEMNVDYGVVCEGSQAEEYSQEFDNRYSRTGASFTIDNPVVSEVSSPPSALDRYDYQEAFLLEATITYDDGSESVDYEAYFLMGDDSAFLGFLGNCITAIVER